MSNFPKSTITCTYDFTFIYKGNMQRSVTYLAYSRSEISLCVCLVYVDFTMYYILSFTFLAFLLHFVIAGLSLLPAQGLVKSTFRYFLGRFLAGFIAQ